MYEPPPIQAWLARITAQATKSKSFLYVLKGVHFTILASFVWLFAADCLHWANAAPSGIHRFAAWTLTVSSYISWMFCTFFSVGYFIFLGRSRAAGQKPKKTRYWRNLVNAIGSPLLYAVYVFWGYTSITTSTPLLGHLSLSAFMVCSIANAIARLKDKRPPRPPRPPRRKRRLPALRYQAA